MVRVTGCPASFCAVAQVACHVPSFSELSARGGSPVENRTVTLPDVCGLPQSSNDCTFSATGNPAETVKAGLSVVSAGISFVGVHTELSLGRRSLVGPDPAVPAITLTLRVCTRPSENWKFTKSLYVPAVKLPSGWITTLVGCLGSRVATLGSGSTRNAPPVGEP